MTLKLLFPSALLAAGAFAQSQPVSKPVDLCAPPPGSVAPSLPAKLLSGQGSVHLPITTKSEEAQKFFDQGLAQMHSFWAREAERSFLQAAALDPEAPMPWWGVAMVAAGDWRPRFQLDQISEAFGPPKRPAKSRAIDAAQKALELSHVPGKATDLEKMYIAAIVARRDGKAKDPDEAFVKGLRQLISKYPKEIEARLDLTLMIMRGFTLPDKKPRNPTSMEAATILRDLMTEAPEHPGVHHYVIHGFEGSTFAKDAWPSSEKYAQLVPNIPHALHMPGHIYSQTARWGDAQRAFEAAAANERSYMKADSLYGSGHHGHNVHYLATSYSFAGQYDKAIENARELLEYKENPREVKAADVVTSAYAQGWFALVRTLVQFRKWDDILDRETIPEPTRPRQQAWLHWARGIAQASTSQTDAAQSELRRMDEAIQQFRLKTRMPAPPELQAARTELFGHLQVAQGKIDRGLRTLQTAAAAERRLRYTEPPWYPRPVLEAVGFIALKHSKTVIAEKAFREALVQYPGDYHAQNGLRAVLKQSPQSADGEF
jgi:tetratricopeptide (TPR) repeat protein